MHTSWFNIIVKRLIQTKQKFLPPKTSTVTPNTLTFSTKHPLTDDKEQTVKQCANAMAGQKLDFKNSSNAPPLKLKRFYFDNQAFKSLYHSEHIHHQLCEQHSELTKAIDLIEQIRFQVYGALSFPGARATQQKILSAQLRQQNDNPTAWLIKFWQQFLDSAIEGNSHDITTGKVLINLLPHQDAFINTVAKHYKNELLLLNQSLNGQIKHSAPEDILNLVSQPKPDNESVKPDDTIPSELTGKPVFNPDIPEAKTLNQGQSETEYTAINNPKTYRAYSKHEDKLIIASQQTSLEEARQFYNHIQQLYPDILKLANRLACKLRQQIMSRQQLHWQHETEDGCLDNKSLNKLVTRPGINSIFRQQQESSFPSTAITLLMDCSGSMKDEPIELSALCIDILCKTLEQCQIKVEVLGFTTGGWEDNPVYQLWQQSGSPANPGRLNSQHHIVFKDFQHPWKQARQSLGILNRTDWMHENIDGEALLWAAQRLQTRPEQRKFLLILSDGSPYDKSTKNANGRDYLKKHLHQAIEQIQKSRSIKLHALGMQDDVHYYYSSCTSIYKVNDLPLQLMQLVSDLMIAK